MLYQRILNVHIIKRLCKTDFNSEMTVSCSFIDIQLIDVSIYSQGPSFEKLGKPKVKMGQVFVVAPETTNAGEKINVIIYMVHI